MNRVDLMFPPSKETRVLRNHKLPQAASLHRLPGEDKRPCKDVIPICFLQNTVLSMFGSFKLLKGCGMALRSAREISFLRISVSCNFRLFSPVSRATGWPFSLCELISHHCSGNEVRYWPRWGFRSEIEISFKFLKVSLSLSLFLPLASLDAGQS